MTVGVKYCGGCNEHFDRVGAVSRLKQELPQHTFCSALGQRELDYLLLVCGCSVRCVGRDNLPAAREIVVVYTPEEIEAFSRRLQGD